MRFKMLLLAFPVLLLAAARPYAAAPPDKGPAAATSRPAAASAFARFDLSSIWRMTGTAEAAAEKVHNGFFGYNYQRLEFVFTSVRRDAQNPKVYHVWGKNRRFNIVRPFAGTFTLDALRRDAAAQSVHEEKPAGHQYLATGQFVLREQSRPGDEAYGTFRGTLAMDLTQPPKGRLELNHYTGNELTKNGGFLLQGTWKDAGSEAELDVVVKNGMAVTHQVMKRFDIGERGSHINPKYARVGWNSFWENKEWWADGQVARR